MKDCLQLAKISSWKEEEKKAFQGWDFSYLTNRWHGENPLWDYKYTIKQFIKPIDRLLDMGTGGGKFLLGLNHPPHQISVTEGYDPNLKLCQENLAPLGIHGEFVGEDDKLIFSDESFDIIINRHESYDPCEVNRVLKPGGYFITQQVGDQNGVNLVQKLLGKQIKSAYKWN